MTLSQADIEALQPALARIGMPLTFQGDRVEAMRLGVSTAIEILKDRVSLDKPPEPPKKG